MEMENEMNIYRTLTIFMPANPIYTEVTIQREDPAMTRIYLAKAASSSRIQTLIDATHDRAY